MTCYVCAFRGRRDNYQVPLALAESGRLERFITDAYAKRALRQAVRHLPERWRRAVEFRSLASLPDGRVTSLWPLAAFEQAKLQLGCSPVRTYAGMDRVFSRVAAQRARAAKADLFLYSPYAWEAFRASYRHTPRRVLFEYHPHPAAEARILAEDVRRYPQIARSYAEATGSRLPAAWQTRLSDAWRMADFILCASQFTMQTVVEAGADPARCAVIPYGVDAPAGEDDAESLLATDSGFEALFVGSGVQRKGLHHLILAWQRARLPERSRLTLVCRNLDPGLRDLVAASPRTRLIPGLPASRLADLYRGSTLFVMPSLVEGFGQVYLEALSHGCPVLGTSHTCLPDLGGAREGIFLVEPGQVDSLAAKLESLATGPLLDGILRVRARQRAREFTWERFRIRLNAVLP